MLSNRITGIAKSENVRAYYPQSRIQAHVPAPFVQWQQPAQNSTGKHVTLPVLRKQAKKNKRPRHQHSKPNYNGSVDDELKQQYQVMRSGHHTVDTKPYKTHFFF